MNNPNPTIVGNLKYWIALNKIPNIGPVTIKKLWEHFGAIRSVWEADEKSLSLIEGLGKSALKSLLENRAIINLEKGLDELEQAGVKALSLEDPGYPVNLINIYDPPPILFCKGEIFASDEKALAIVGTRKASTYGIEFAKKMAAELASMGITIVSGMAAGIDTSAHKGAIEAGGRTIAVFGCGVDIIYPPENKQLSGEIIRKGALVSEFPVGAKIEKGNFPRRNRIVSGLTKGVIVVEGHYDSGAMITAKEALEQGREVFAVPGSVEMEQSKGPHWLIKQGAKLVESVEDVLEELHMVMPKKMSNLQFPMSNEGINYSKLSSDEQKIVLVLTKEPKHLDNLSAESGLSIPQVSSLLMMLEVKNVVRQLPGKMFLLS